MNAPSFDWNYLPFFTKQLVLSYVDDLAYSYNTNQVDWGKRMGFFSFFERFFLTGIFFLVSFWLS